MNIKTLAAAALLAVLSGASALAAESVKSDVDRVLTSTSQYASDSALTAKVKAALLAEKNLKSLDISVESSSGVVTLFGRVDSSAQSRQAEDVVKHVEGVKGVHNTLALKTDAE